MRTEINEKVLAMYRAVWTLIDEGWDIHKLKVADITKRAGIGKGTAYEYFRSKEEILRNAMAYDFFMQYKALEDRIRKQDNFQDAIRGCFSWIMENRDRRRFAMQFVKREGLVDRRNLQGFGEREEKGSCGLERLGKLLEYLTELGKKDGCISQDIPVQFASLQIFSQVLSFFIWQESEPSPSGEELERLREFLLGNLLQCMAGEGRCLGKQIQENLVEPSSVHDGNRENR